MKVIYSDEILDMMRNHISQLPERLRRQYAAIESRKLGYGGVSYISRALHIDRKTILLGRKELSGLCDNFPSNRQRKPGGGRKKKLQKVANSVPS